MYKIIQMIHTFLQNIDWDDVCLDMVNIGIALDYNALGKLMGISVYDTTISSIDTGLGYKSEKGTNCKIFEITDCGNLGWQYWIGADYRLALNLTKERLKLLQDILEIIEREEKEYEREEFISNESI